MGILFPKKPQALQPIFDTIPTELTAKPQWVLWRYQWRTKEQKWTKPPYQANGAKASTTNADTWTNFATVKAAYEDCATDFDGIGFVFNDDYIGTDWDNNIHIETLLTKINSYAEYSPSGNGIHSITIGKLESGARKNGVEMYSKGRFFTVTGHKLPNAPTIINAANGAIHALYEEITRHVQTTAVPPQPPTPTDLQFSLAFQAVQHKLATDHIFAATWNGTAKYHSASEAAYGLRKDLLRLSYGNEQLADQLFKASPLYQINPEKWDRLAHTETEKLLIDISKETTTAAKRFQRTTLLEAFNQKPPLWLFAPYLVANESNVLFAPSGTGKTAFAVWLTVQLALQGKRVLYGAMENYRGVAARLKAYIENLNIDPTTLPIETFDTPFYLNGNGDVSELITDFADYKCDLIIFDTLTNITKGSLLKDEVIKDAFDSIRRIEAGLGCASWTLTHTGWTNQDREAGSMSLRNNSSHTLGLEVLDSSASTLKVLFAKTRHFDVHTLPEITLKLKSATTEMCGESFTGVWAEPQEGVGWTFTAKLSADCITMLKILSAVESANFTALIDLTHWDRKRLTKTCAILKGRGLVSKDDRKSPYTVSEMGRKFLHEFQD